MESSRGLLNEISAVLSGPQNTTDSEDIKSALIELLKVIRSREMVGQRLKQLISPVLSLLKHKEVRKICGEKECENR